MDRFGDLTGVGRLAALVAGVAMMLWGLTTVLATLGVRVPALLRLNAGAGPWASLLARARDLGPRRRALALGALTALLPCGWLYVFVASAAASGAAPSGALVMLVFWAGTLPAFAALGLAAQRAAGPLRRHLPLVTGGVLLVLGLVTATGRGAAHRHAAGATRPAPVMHDGHAR